MILHEKISAQLPAWRERIKALSKEHADVVVDKVTVGQIAGGMRDIKSLLTDVSYVDSSEGIRFRGLSIPEVLKRLPKARGTKIPLVGGLYYLLMVGEVPTMEEAMAVEDEWDKRAEIPDYVYKMLKTMPKDAHPMILLNLAVMSLERNSVFSKRYREGMKKDEYWEPALEDSLDLTAKIPVIAAFIYRYKYFGEKKKPIYRVKLDYGANFARMMKVADKKGYAELARLYFILHSDHESGNVSAHATHLVGSSLSDIYFAYSAGLSGLAGPLHGLANQECLGWLLDVHKKFGGVPSRDDLYKFAWDTLHSGKVIPGYGHAVLRVPDPRFTAQMEFAKARFPDDDLVRLADMVFDVVPTVLKEQGKAKNPAPNVDAISGTLQHYYGVREFDFYTVLFGVGRALGVTANYVWSRALGMPIERPKSLTTKMLEDVVAKAIQPGG
ncbi:MAG: citrate (Si)-synthase [Chloroflexi bacterium]|nr:citrate (Si)-synthase [Chloroflexi bacterium CFX1]MCK6566407.1 citrate (Si)-synthase [Anaerolineales bacterium]MCQ3951659.1 citrate (Si)-synthase [Chloroflexota bacterium]MDL1920737.1 citrate (Si)-synthase [Chloroflexi bacterium CFX5]NUQ59876.1 citrate (Si)-synthase [Anaerolineales bacterium]